MTHIALHLRDIHSGRRTGRLVFRRGDVQKYFFFQDGHLIQVKTSVPEERLGEVLFKLERISRETLAGIDQHIEPAKSIGQVLVARGLIKPQDLTDALVYQMRESVLNAFAAFDAQMAFQEREKFELAEGDTARMQIPFLIEFGIRRMDYDPHLKTFLGRKTFAPGRKTYIYLLSEDEREVLTPLEKGEPPDGVQAALRSAPEVFWKTVFLLYGLGLVEFRGGDSEAAEPTDRNRPQAASPAAPAGPGAAPAAAAEPGREAPESPLAKVMSLKSSLGTLNHYQLLGIARDAGDADIKKAYFAAARQFHPDRFGREIAAAQRAVIDEVFNAVTSAYRTLSDPEKKKAYDESLSGGAASDIQEIYRKADIKFRQGKTLYTQGRYPEAVVMLEEAVRLRKAKADYHILLAMAESRIPSLIRKAEADFLKAVELEAWNPEGYLGLGLLYKKEGLTTKALRYLQKAVEVDSDHQAARAELAKMEGEGKKKGLFSMDLFKPRDKPRKKK